MADQGEHYEMSWILHHILDRMIGSRELLDIRRKMTLVMENAILTDKLKHLLYHTGSRGEGISMIGSDADLMFIDRRVEVMCSNQDTNIPSDNRDMTVLVMRKADCRSCYVTLELVQASRYFHEVIIQSIVPVRDRLFVSSEINSKSFQELILGTKIYLNAETHGPASSVKSECSDGCDFDMVLSYRCTGWPPEANEWLRRPRQHGWPSEALIYDISKSGCHVVPVGDKTSADTFLQWRISFATAERKLIYSLSHEQFLIYGLLKYFLKHISEMLKNKIGDADILSSYIMKTVIFFAVENTPKHLWKEQNTFMCFRLCLKILITWVNAGCCPNFFIVSNNMFQGKLHDGNQKVLLCFLLEMYDMKWKCLSVGTFIQPTIGVIIQSVMDGHWESILVSPSILEYEKDMNIFQQMYAITQTDYARSLSLLYKSKSDVDEFIAYYLTVQALYHEAIKMFGEQQTATGNKQKYKFLRKCKNIMEHCPSVCTSAGLPLLATFYYQTGNYMKALLACRTMLSSFKLFTGNANPLDKDDNRYKHLYCGRGYTLLHKWREAVMCVVVLYESFLSFCPPQLHQELTECAGCLCIPPLPYAMFLSFLCYHELDDRRRRDIALTQLRAVKYDKKQGRSEFWIVNNLVGICYELIGDTQRAIREYKESLTGGNFFRQFNPAREKIARLQHSQSAIFSESALKSHT